jgi:16S rRNA (cytosine967-C5)-methyltransferase
MEYGKTLQLCDRKTSLRIATLIQHSAELIRIVYNSPQPTDKILSEFFRSKKQYGSKERRFVVNTIYFVLRNFILLNKISEIVKVKIDKNFNENEWKVIIALILAKEFPEISQSYIPDELISKVESNENTESILQEIFEEDFDSLRMYLNETFTSIKNSIIEISDLELTEMQYHKLETRFSFPIQILNKIINTFNSKDELISFLQNSTEQAPLSLRINTQKTNADEVFEYFKLNQPELKSSEIVPTCAYTYHRIQLTENQLYKEGKIEIQDEGSQLISIILSPKENEIILDACAGAGGKSLHIATLQKDKGIIIANDIEFQRLKEIPKRSDREGITTIITHLSNKGKDNFVEILKLSKGHLFDKVLIDAPCTGSGTIRRDPLKKYRISQKLIEKINSNQLKILQEYSRFVRPDGILVYSTCSIFSEENEMVVNKFLEKNPNFAPFNISKEDTSQFNHEKVRINNFCANIDFRNTVSDGFFMAKMKRID